VGTDAGLARVGCEHATLCPGGSLTRHCQSPTGPAPDRSLRQERGSLWFTLCGLPQRRPKPTSPRACKVMGTGPVFERRYLPQQFAAACRCGRERSGGQDPSDGVHTEAESWTVLAGDGTVVHPSRVSLRT
jgi:hypothetical protein